MMNHYRKDGLTPEEANELIAKVIAEVTTMEIRPTVMCHATRKIWNEKTFEWDEVEKRVSVYCYFHENEKPIADKLSGMLELMSSF